MTHIENVEIAEDFAKLFEKVDTFENRQRHEFTEVLQRLCQYGVDVYEALSVSSLYDMYVTLQEKSDILPKLTEEEFLSELEEYILPNREFYLNFFEYQGVRYIAQACYVSDFEKDEYRDLDKIPDDDEYMPSEIACTFRGWKEIADVPFYRPTYEELKGYCDVSYPKCIKEYGRYLEILLEFYVEESIQDRMFAGIFSQFRGETVDEHDPEYLEKRYTFEEATNDVDLKFNLFTMQMSCMVSVESIFATSIKEFAYGLNDKYREEVHRLIDKCRWKTGSYPFKGHSPESLKKQYPKAFKTVMEDYRYAFDYQKDSYEKIHKPKMSEEDNKEQGK